MFSGKTFHEFNIDEGKSISVDASQRMVLVTNKGGKNKDKRIVCAEPSPDSIVAAAAQLAANRRRSASNGSSAYESSAEVDAGFNQSVASIGIRTPTIQLLRDGFYRACEAMMNGAISDGEYMTILENIDNVMISLLAIEGLTQMERAPGVAISSVSVGKTTEEEAKAGVQRGGSLEIESLPSRTKGGGEEAVADAVQEIVTKFLDVDEHRHNRYSEQRRYSRSSEQLLGWSQEMRDFN